MQENCCFETIWRQLDGERSQIDACIIVASLTCNRSFSSRMFQTTYCFLVSLNHLESYELNSKTMTESRLDSLKNEINSLNRAFLVNFYHKSHVSSNDTKFP